MPPRKKATADSGPAAVEAIHHDETRVNIPTGELRDFALDGLEFDQLVDFYSHGAHWSNRMILGDSLLAMTSLAEKEAMRGKVQMFYMDPPYGIKFGSNRQVSTRKRDVKDGKVDDATRQPEQVKAFRHRLQQRELLRAPRLLHRRRRPLREAQARPAQ